MKLRTLLFSSLGLAAALFAGSCARADHAGALRAVLAQIKLPPGFHISLYALAPQARDLAVSPDGQTIIVGTKGDKVYRVSVDLTAPPKVAVFAPEEKFTLPTGPCFAPDGALFLAEFDRVLKFARTPKGWDEDHPSAIIPAGKLVPPEVTSHGHGMRVCRVGPDHRLYVAIGQPHNVAPKDKLALYRQWGVGGIISTDLDGKNREVFAEGVRNSVGMDFNPRDGVLWFTDNQVDMLGDDIPPEELNKAPRPGLNFGFPWYGGGHVRTHEYADEKPPADVVFPEVELTPHGADLGMTFYRGEKFPREWRGVFIGPAWLVEPDQTRRREGRFRALPRRQAGRHDSLRRGLEQGPDALSRPTRGRRRTAGWIACCLRRPGRRAVPHHL